MKLNDRIKTIILNIKSSVRRFPITIIMSTLLVFVLIYQIELSRNGMHDNENLQRISMVLGLGIVLSLCIGLINERFIKNKSKGIIGYAIGGAILVLYYTFLIKDFQMVTMTRYLGTLLFLILAFFYIPRLKQEHNYENYVIRVFSSGVLTAIYSGVLYLGTIAIIFTIQQLFDVNIRGQIYLYTFLIVVFIFGVSLFLSKLGEVSDDPNQYDYSKSLKVLLAYIVIPLISVYTIILYAYFAKILFTWEWPKDLVSHLVLWYSAISVGVIFLITPVIEENKITKQFRVWFPRFVLPILVMMFMSILQRVEQYGLTENRYFVILLGIWVLGIMMYFNLKRVLRNIFIPISLSIVVLLSVYGPFSSYSLSIRSQNYRLNRILSTNEMIQDDTIISNPSLNSESQKEINNIIYYFNRYHSLDDIKILPKDFKLEDTEQIFGFEYNSYNPYESNNEYFHYGTMLKHPINISDYDYYINISSWNNQAITIDDINIRYDNNKHSLIINESEETILDQDMIIIIEEFIEENKLKSENQSKINDLDLIYTIDNDKLKATLIFSNINGRINNDKVILQGTEFILLLEMK